MPKKTFDQVSEQDITHEMVNSHIIEELKAKEGVKIVAKPIDIFAIVPDVTQPRRAIPFSVRRSYENTAHNVPLMLEEWHIRAEQAHGRTIPVRELITGYEETDTENDTPTILRDYLDLISLAASIHREGLTNAITVSDVGDLKRIETGERRYLAHHLLTMYVDEVKYARIAAQTVTRDVWRQASENGARKPLNAIGLARQLALLIMDMYSTDKDVFFDKFEALVLPGECDRKFYAQVANGNRYRIKRGMSQKILDVTGLKSRSQIQQYRNLLSLPDELWNEADENDYTEFRIRSMLDEINNTNRAGQNTPENDTMSPVGDIYSENNRHEAPASSSALPDRKTPQTTIQHRTTETYQGDSDPDLDHDAYYNRGQDTYTQSRSHDSSPPTIEHSDGEIKLHQLRTQHTQTINILIHFAKILNGQDITVARYTEDDEPIFTTITFEGDHLIKTLESYLNDSFQDIQLLIQTLGRDGMHDDIETANHNLLDIFEHLSDQVVYFMKSCIATVLDYSD